MTQEHQKGAAGVFNAVHVAIHILVHTINEVYIHPPLEDTQKLPFAVKAEAVTYILLPAIVIPVIIDVVGDVIVVNVVPEISMKFQKNIT